MAGWRAPAPGARSWRSPLGALNYTVTSPQQPSKSQAHCYAPPESRPVTPAAAMATPPVENAVSLMTFKPLSGRAFIVNSIIPLRQRTSLTLPCAVSSGRTPVPIPAGQRPGQVRTSPSVLRHCGGAPSCAAPPAASLLPNESRGRAGPASSDRFPRPPACAQPGATAGRPAGVVATTPGPGTATDRTGRAAESSVSGRNTRAAIAPRRPVPQHRGRDLSRPGAAWCAGAAVGWARDRRVDRGPFTDAPSASRRREGLVPQALFLFARRGRPCSRAVAGRGSRECVPSPGGPRVPSSSQ